MSVLSRQALILKGPGFRERYPHGWLVWERGTWHVPHEGEELGATRLPHRDVVDCLPSSDVMCFELSRSDDADTQTTLKLGRAAECDFEVSDATVSREHLQFGFDGDRWWVQPVEGAAACTINGVPLDRDHRTPLISGVQLTVGDITLTYHSAESFGARVQAEAERLAGSAVRADDDAGDGAPFVRVG